MMNVSTMKEIPAGTTALSSQTAKIQLIIRDLLLPAWLPLSFPTGNSGSDITTTTRGSHSGAVRLSTTTILEGEVNPIAGRLLMTDDPSTLFHTLLVSLVSLTIFVRILHGQLKKRSRGNSNSSSNQAHEDDNTRSGVRRVRIQKQERRVSMSLLSPSLKRLQFKFLSVFWLLRTSFWMSGPYFYAAYASKTGGDASLISQISLAGYAAIALLGPILGKLTDHYGRKLGTIMAALLYGLGSLSIMANPLWALFLGRALSGVGTSLLSAAPEAWLVSAFNHGGMEKNPTFLQQTFGMAYAYDSICAIAAGQLAGFAAHRAGPTGPFQASPIFLAIGTVLAILFWEENKALPSTGGAEDNRNRKEDDATSTTIPTSDDDDDDDDDDSESSDSSDSDGGSPQRQAATIWDAFSVIRSDKKIMFLGGVQSFFEGAMYIFVMQWPPTINRAIQKAFGTESETPYGTAFSCFMACCMAGSTVFGILARRNKIRGSPLSFEKQTVALLGIACLAMIGATSAISSARAQGNNNNNNNNQGQELWQLIAAYFLFEACVGMYFPSIGTLRSKYLPDTHRSLIMTLFGVPLNIIVVIVFLLVHKLGDVGGLAVAAVSLGLATICMMGLFLVENHKLVAEKKRRKFVRDRFKQIVRKVQVMKDVSETCREQLLRQATRERRNTFSTFSGPQFF